MKKDYSLGSFSSSELEDLITRFEKIQGETEVYRIVGSLQDEFLVDVSGIRFRYGVNRKWLIARESYLNEWSSILDVTLTDNDKKAEAFIDEYDEAETVPNF